VKSDDRYLKCRKLVPLSERQASVSGDLRIKWALDDCARDAWHDVPLSEMGDVEVTVSIRWTPRK
jgi:hypothetical protein